MKKLYLITALLLMFCATACATITNVQETHHLKMDYPVIQLDDIDAQENINYFISKKIAAFKKDFDKHNYAEAAVTYDVKYEDDDYLAIAFTYWWYYPRAAHGMYDTTGVVFDKYTGKLIPLKNFMQPISAKQLDAKIRSGELTLYNAAMQPIDLIDFWNVERISQSYYIDAEKNVYLIYQPYELACYAAGNTYIKIPAK